MRVGPSGRVIICAVGSAEYLDQRPRDRKDIQPALPTLLPHNQTHRRRDTGWQGGATRVRCIGRVTLDRAEYNRRHHLSSRITHYRPEPIRRLVLSDGGCIGGARVKALRRWDLRRDRDTRTDAVKG